MTDSDVSSDSEDSIDADADAGTGVSWQEHMVQFLRTNAVETEKAHPDQMDEKGTNTFNWEDVRSHMEKAGFSELKNKPISKYGINFCNYLIQISNRIKNSLVSEL